jgi:hypothetical protein
MTDNRRPTPITLDADPAILLEAVRWERDTRVGVGGGDPRTIAHLEHIIAQLEKML